jgi:anti-anti-sigma factor
VQSQVHYADQCIYVRGEMTLDTSTALKLEVIASIVENRDVQWLDLAQVTEIDPAGLQVLLFARRYAKSRGFALGIRNSSAVISEALALCWISHEPE